LEFMDGIYPTESQWCSDGVAAASTGKGPPTVSEFLMCLLLTLTNRPRKQKKRSLSRQLGLVA